MKHSMRSRGHTRLFQSVLSVMLVLLMCASLIPVDAFASTETPTDAVEEAGHVTEGDSLELGGSSEEEDSTVIRDPLDGNTGEDDLIFVPEDVQEPTTNAAPYVPDTDENRMSAAVEDKPKVDITAENTQSVAVQVIWNDNNNARKLRPEKYEVNLTADTMLYGDTVSLSASNWWYYKWNDLSMNHLFQIELVRLNIPGYRTEVTSEFIDEEEVGADYTLYTITNTIKEGPAFVTVTARITWEDDDPSTRPQNIRVKLLRDNMYFTDTYFEGKATDIMLSEANNWEYTWSGLDSSFEWELDFGETAVPGYVSYQSYNAEDNKDLDITFISYGYTYTFFDSPKDWIDVHVHASFEEGLEWRPEKLEVSGSGNIITLTPEEDWTSTRRWKWDGGGYNFRTPTPSDHIPYLCRLYANVDTDPITGQRCIKVELVVTSQRMISTSGFTDLTVTVHWPEGCRDVQKVTASVYSNTASNGWSDYYGGGGREFLTLNSKNNYSQTVSDLSSVAYYYLEDVSSPPDGYDYIMEVHSSYDSDGKKHWVYDIYVQASNIVTPTIPRTIVMHINWDDNDNEAGIRPYSVEVAAFGSSVIKLFNLYEFADYTGVIREADAKQLIFPYQLTIYTVPVGYTMRQHVYEDEAVVDGEAVPAVIVEWTLTLDNWFEEYGLDVKIDYNKAGILPEHVTVYVYEMVDGRSKQLLDRLSLDKVSDYSRHINYLYTHKQFVFIPETIAGYTYSLTIVGDTLTVTYTPCEYNTIDVRVNFDESVPMDARVWLPIELYGVGTYSKSEKFSCDHADDAVYENGYIMHFEDVYLARPRMASLHADMTRHYSFLMDTETILNDNGYYSIVYTFNVSWNSVQDGYSTVWLSAAVDWGDVPTELRGDIEASPSGWWRPDKPFVFTTYGDVPANTLCAENNWYIENDDLYGSYPWHAVFGNFEVPGYSYYVTRDEYPVDDITTRLIYVMHWVATPYDGYINVTARVNWVDDNTEGRPAEQRLRLYRNGELYKEERISEKDNWEYTWEGLNGAYTWTVMWWNWAMRGYESYDTVQFTRVDEVTIDQVYTLNVVKTDVPIFTDLTAEVVWVNTPENKIPSQVPVRFLYMNTAIIPGEDDVTGEDSFKDCYILEKNKGFVYNLEDQLAFGNYSLEIPVTPTGFNCILETRSVVEEREGFKIRHIYYTIQAEYLTDAVKEERIYMEFRPSWNDDGGWNQPEYLVMDLLCDGLVYSSFTINGGKIAGFSVTDRGNDWSIVEHSHLGEYTIEVTEISKGWWGWIWYLNYTSTAKVPDITDLIVVSTWADRDYAGRPEYVDVQLYCEGEEVGSPVRLDNYNDWQYEYRGLDGTKSYTAEQLTELPDSYKTTTACHKYATDAGSGYKGYTVLSFANEHSSAASGKNTYIAVKEVWFGDQELQKPNDLSVGFPNDIDEPVIQRVDQEGMWSHVWYDINAAYAKVDVNNPPQRGYQSRMRSNGNTYLVANICDARATEAWDLPETGGFGIDKLELIGAAMAIATALVLFTSSKKREFEDQAQ